MKLTCNRKLLTNAILGVSKAVPTRSTIPVLEGILFHSEGFTLTLTGYDLEMAIITEISANILEPGNIVLNAKLISDMIRRMNSEEVEITVNEKGVATIKGGITEYNINSLSAEEYPELPKQESEFTFALNNQHFKNLVENTIYAVSQDEKKPAHTGELFEITKNKLTVVALDGYRMAIMEQEIACEQEMNFIIPAKTLSETIKLLKDETEEIQISTNQRFIVFSTKEFTVISRLIEGEFLDYKRVLTQQTDATTVIVNVRDFIDAIERASLIITERLKSPVCIQFDDTITVRCQTTLGNVVDEISAKKSGQSVEVGFNHRYLLDSLRNTHCEFVKIHISGPLAPVQISPCESSEFLFLILPTRL